MKSFVQSPIARNVQQGILGVGKPGWKQKTQGHGKREAWITKGWRPPGPRGRVERGMGAIRNEGRQREF